jgi:hypothetical protein
LNLQNADNQIIADMQYADASLATAISFEISVEVSSRIAGDQYLQNNIDAASTASLSRDNSLASAMSTADASLAASLDREASVRLSADASLATAASVAMSSEVSSRVAGDASLATAASAEASSRVAGDASLATSINNEASIRLSADNSLASAMSTADASLASSINTEKGRIDAILSGADVNLDQFVEVVSYVNSIDLTNDNALLSSMVEMNANLSTETSARIAGDASLESKITADIASNYSRVSYEFGTADASLATAISDLDGKYGEATVSLANDLAAEITRATSMELTLDSKIKDMLSNTDLKAIDSFTEVVGVVNELINTINTLGGAPYTEVITSTDGEMFRLSDPANYSFDSLANVDVYINGLLAIGGLDYNIEGVDVIRLAEPVMGSTVVVKANLRSGNIANI